MPINYNRMAATASRLINENGRPVVIKRPAKGDDAPAEEYKTKGVLTQSRARMIDGTLVKTSDRTLLLDGQIKPLSSDRIFMDGKKVGDIIDPVEEVNPGGTPIVYRVQVKI